MAIAIREFPDFLILGLTWADGLSEKFEDGNCYHGVLSICPVNPRDGNCHRAVSAHALPPQACRTQCCRLSQTREVHMQAEAVSTVNDPGTWEMHAAADGEDSPNPLRHFGPPGYALQDGSASRVVRVRLTATDDPAPDDYWAWLDHGATQPSCIGATEQDMTRRFLLGENVPGPREEQAVGQGQILRLRVTVLGEMLLRASSRHSWKYSSAL
jgi:hypothetical protein